MMPSFWQIILVLIPLILLPLWLTVRILSKAGYSGWWCLATLVPILNLVMIWVFAYADWLALRPAVSAPASNPD